MFRRALSLRVGASLSVTSSQESLRLAPDVSDFLLRLNSTEEGASSPTQIREQYRKLILKYHPDAALGSSKENVAQQFLKIQEAYENSRMLTSKRNVKQQPLKSEESGGITLLPFTTLVPRNFIVSLAEDPQLLSHWCSWVIEAWTAAGEVSNSNKHNNKAGKEKEYPSSLLVHDDDAEYQIPGSIFEDVFNSLDGGVGKDVRRYLMEALPNSSSFHRKKLDKVGLFAAIQEWLPLASGPQVHHHPTSVQHQPQQLTRAVPAILSQYVYMFVRLLTTRVVSEITSSHEPPQRKIKLLKPRTLGRILPFLFSSTIPEEVLGCFSPAATFESCKAIAAQSVLRELDDYLRVHLDEQARQDEMTDIGWSFKTNSMEIVEAKIFLRVRGYAPEESLAEFLHLFPHWYCLADEPNQIFFDDDGSRAAQVAAAATKLKVALTWPVTEATTLDLLRLSRSVVSSLKLFSGDRSLQLHGLHVEYSGSFSEAAGGEKVVHVMGIPSQQTVETHLQRAAAELFSTSSTPTMSWIDDKNTPSSSSARWSKAELLTPQCWKVLSSSDLEKIEFYENYCLMESIKASAVLSICESDPHLFGAGLQGKLMVESLVSRTPQLFPGREESRRDVLLSSENRKKQILARFHWGANFKKPHNAAWLLQDMRKVLDFITKHNRKPSHSELKSKILKLRKEGWQSKRLSQLDQIGLSEGSSLPWL